MGLMGVHTRKESKEKKNVSYLAASAKLCFASASSLSGRLSVLPLVIELRKDKKRGVK